MKTRPSESTRSRMEQLWARLGQPAGDTGQLLGSLAVTIISVGMLVGGFLLSQLDAVGMPIPATRVAAISPSPTMFWPTTSPTPSPLPSPSPTPTPDASVTPTPSPVSSLIPSCRPPAGWSVYIVRTGDTLYSLAVQAKTTELALMQANCLSTPAIYSGQRIYLPPTLHATPTPRTEPCGPPSSWIIYVVQRGDTLFSLSRRFGVSIQAIRQANCLEGFDIYVGQALYLPPPPPTPVATSTPTLPNSPTPTIPTTSTLPSSPTATPLPVSPSPTISVPTPTSTPVSTSTVTHTPAPSPTSTTTLEPTPTPAPTGQLTPTLTSTQTPVFTPTGPHTPTSTPRPTPTPTPTSTAMSTSTSTSTVTVTVTPPPTPSATPSEG